MRWNELLLHPLTAKHLQALLSNPPQALLLSGPRGCGLLTTATVFAESIGVNAGSVRLMQPDEKGTISIDSVRTLYPQTRSRMNEKLIFIIDDAHAMGAPAQNAFLKLLEEPNPSVIFILTSHDPGLLLPTIHSRLQTIDIRPISRQASLDLILRRGETDKTIQAQLLFVAVGLPAELTRLTGDRAHLDDMLQLAGKAKRFISGTRYEQLVLISGLSARPREEVQYILRLSTNMLKSQLSKSPDDLILQKIMAILGASEKITQNGHVRTQLMRIIN